MAIAAVIALSKHDSSQVALVASSLVVLLLAWKWRTSRLSDSLAVACGALHLFWSFRRASLAYDNGLHFANWLPKLARARIILWNIRRSRFSTVLCSA